MESKAQKAALSLYEEKIKNLIEVAKRGGTEYNTFYDTMLNESLVVGDSVSKIILSTTTNGISTLRKYITR